MSLDQIQTDALLRPIVKERVSSDGKGFSHVQAYDVRRRLIEIFGFGGWSGEVTDMHLIFEQEVTLLKKDYKTKQPIPGTEYQAWNVAYRCTYRLTVHATGAVYTESATGDSTNQPSRSDAHDMAVKTAESQAFKRAAVNLGSQAGLSLYDSNNPYGPVVRYVLGSDPARINDDGTITRPTVRTEADTTDHVKAPVTPENSPAGPAEQAEPSAAPTRQGTGETDWSLIIRNRVVDEAPTKPANGRKAFLARQLIAAGQHGVADSLVADEADGYVPLKDLIQTALKAAA